MQKLTTKKIARTGVISAIYAVTCLLTLPISGGAVQMRVSEALTLLPLFMPESVIALFVGCLIANLITGCFLLDVILGSLVTLLAGFLTYLVGRIIKNLTLKVIIGGLFPVLLNAFLLPVIWYFAYGQLEYVYWLQVLLLFVGQTASVYIFGSLLVIAVNKLIKKGKII